MEDTKSRYPPLSSRIFLLFSGKGSFLVARILDDVGDDVGFGIQLRKIQAFFLVKSVKFPCKIVFLAFESRSKRRLRQPSHGWEGSADRRDSSRCLSRAASMCFLGSSSRAYPMLFPLTSSDRRTVVAPFQPSRNSNLAGT